MSPVPETATDLDVLHARIVDSIKTAFSVFATVEAYREDRKDLPIPACLVELVDMEVDPEEEVGTEQLPALTRWEARVILGFREPDVERAAAKIGAALGLHIRRQKWSLPVHAAEVTAISPDEFSPHLDRFVCWTVEWQQLVYFGESVWNADGTLPTMVLSAVMTDDGSAPTVEDYEPVPDPAAAADGQWDDDAELVGGAIWGAEP